MTKFVRSGLWAVVLFAAACGGGQRPLERWSDRHPDASRALGEWVREHRQAAKLLFEWDGHHPGKAQDFVVWSIEHPEGRLIKFVEEHPGWPDFDEIVATHVEGTELFMRWCHHHHDAALDLVQHPGGLEWAGHHLYREYVQFENH